MTKLKITTTYTSGKWVVDSEVVTDDEGFPTEVFLWTVARNGSLGEFQAIGHIDQVAKYKSYDSSRTSNFGIHLVKYDSSRQTLSSEEDASKATTVLKSAFQILLDGYTESSKPVEEFYP